MTLGSDDPYFRMSDELRERLTSAGPRELQAVIDFFDAPYLRRQFATLLELARSELRKRDGSSR